MHRNHHFIPASCFMDFLIPECLCSTTFITSWSMFLDLLGIPFLMFPLVNYNKFGFSSEHQWPYNHHNPEQNIILSTDNTIRKQFIRMRLHHFHKLFCVCVSCCYNSCHRVQYLVQYSFVFNTNSTYLKAF